MGRTSFVLSIVAGLGLAASLLFAHTTFGGVMFLVSGVLALGAAVVGVGSRSSRAGRWGLGLGLLELLTVAFLVVWMSGGEVSTSGDDGQESESTDRP